MNWRELAGTAPDWRGLEETRFWLDFQAWRHRNSVYDSPSTRGPVPPGTPMTNRPSQSPDAERDKKDLQRLRAKGQRLRPEHMGKENAAINEARVLAQTERVQRELAERSKR